MRGRLAYQMCIAIFALLSLKLRIVTMTGRYDLQHHQDGQLEQLATYCGVTANLPSHKKQSKALKNDPASKNCTKMF